LPAVRLTPHRIDVTENNNFFYADVYLRGCYWAFISKAKLPGVTFKSVLEEARATVPPVKDATPVFHSRKESDSVPVLRGPEKKAGVSVVH
jgi:hypothetical protein